MHRIDNKLEVGTALETIGVTLHHASEYDLHTRLMGLGVNGANSRMIVEMAQIKPGDIVLDVGCGTGNLTLTARGYVGPSGSSYGIDASPEMIDVARKKAKRSGLDAVFQLGLIERIDYPEATFDVVISRLVIHHLPDDLKRRAFAEIMRVLKPGGLFFVADFRPPTNAVLAHIALVLFGHQMMMQSNVSALPAMLREAGFGDVASGPTRSRFLDFVSGRKPAR